MRWNAVLLMLAVGCGSTTTIPDLPTDGPAESANTWQPGQIEDARDAPEEKIDAYSEGADYVIVPAI